MDEGSLSTTEQWHYQCDAAGGGAQLIMVWAANFLTQLIMVWYAILFSCLTIASVMAMAPVWRRS